MRYLTLMLVFSSIAAIGRETSQRSFFSSENSGVNLANLLRIPEEENGFPPHEDNVSSKKPIQSLLQELSSDYTNAESTLAEAEEALKKNGERTTSHEIRKDPVEEVQKLNREEEDINGFIKPPQEEDFH